MGGPAAEFKAFADATGGRWYHAKWREKIAFGFTISNSPSGDKQVTLQYLSTLAMQHGMIWAGLGELPMQAIGINRLGSSLGVMAQASLVEDDKATGERLGHRIASLVAQRKT
jgi:NAD(P)H dehydrogenase (quinone)